MNILCLHLPRPVKQPSDFFDVSNQPRIILIKTLEMKYWIHLVVTTKYDGVQTQSSGRAGIIKNDRVVGLYPTKYTSFTHLYILYYTYVSYSMHTFPPHHPYFQCSQCIVCEAMYYFVKL